MSEQGITGVVGTDGNVPVYNANGLWQMWGIGDIWRGDVGAHKHVPKVDDYVIDPATYTMYIVEEHDPVTLVPRLREIRPANMSFTLTETDVLFGVNGYNQSDTYRVYIDQSVIPHVLAVDIRLKIAGSMASYCKLFKGSDVSTTGHVVSKTYDSNGQFIGENVPLELVAIDSHNNYSIKTVAVCHTTEDLINGEVVTAVIYNDQGHVVSKRQLLVENTSFIRSVNASQRYISHISIESAFLSPTEDHVIRFPLNIPMNALNIIGVVHYSNGQTLRLPVDGSKFKMFGLDQHISSIIGQQVDLVLSYALSSDEVSYAGVTGDGHYITEPYQLVTVNPNNSYSVKLFGYPFWVNEATGYQMRWWLFNLDRNVFFEVTSWVRFADNTGAFNPKGYGYLQRKSVSINLKDVSGSFNSFVHVQLVDIVLSAPPDNSPTQTAWTMSHESISSRPLYGNLLYCKRVGTNLIDITSTISTFDLWKERMYLHTYPLLDRTAELNPPAPTHFVVNVGGVESEFAIEEWSQQLLVSVDPLEHGTVTVRFVKRTSSGDMQLSIAALSVKY